MSEAAEVQDALQPVDDDKLLTVRNLDITFHGEHGSVQVVEQVSFDIDRGGTVGLVGESGSGKTVTSLALMRMLQGSRVDVTADQLLFDSNDLLRVDDRQLEAIRGNEIAMVFQDPTASLNPAFTVGQQISNIVRRHRGVSAREAMNRTVEVLELVGIPNARARASHYPHQFSGGMAQRAMIAMALSCGPKLLIADEPTSALDVTIQAQILDLLDDLQRTLGMTMLFITHDLGVVAELCDRVLVMYAGQIVEDAPVLDLFDAPLHPYTTGLIQATPGIARTGDRLASIPGSPPPPGTSGPGCRFAVRCPYSTEACRAEAIELREVDNRHVRCVRAEEVSRMAP